MKSNMKVSFLKLKLKSAIALTWLELTKQHNPWIKDKYFQIKFAKEY